MANGTVSFRHRSFPKLAVPTFRASPEASAKSRRPVLSLVALTVLVVAVAPLAAAQRTSATSTVGRVSAGRTSGGPVALAAVVDPGAELLGIMLWVSGGYPQPVDSEYKSAVWAHFGPYREHPALARLKRLSTYPDFTEVGLQLQGFPDARAVLPDSMSWYRTYSRDMTAAVLADGIAFADATGFWAFYERHRADYEAWSAGFEQGLAERAVVPALDGFFRYGASRPRPRVTVLMEPLNGWGAHAVDFQRLRGEPNGDRVTFTIGPSSSGETLPDSPVRFQGTPQTVATVWHEGSHVYLRPLLDRSQGEIAKTERLFDAAALARQNVTTWSYAFEENLVRAVTAVLMRQVYGEEAYARELRTQAQRGFGYVADLADLISSEYVARPERYADFDAFFPEVLARLASEPSTPVPSAP